LDARVIGSHRIHLRRIHDVPARRMRHTLAPRSRAPFTADIPLRDLLGVKVISDGVAAVAEMSLSTGYRQIPAVRARAASQSGGVALARNPRQISAPAHAPSPLPETPAKVFEGSPLFPTAELMYRHTPNARLLNVHFKPACETRKKEACFQQPISCIQYFS